MIAFASSAAAQDAYDALVAKHAAANGVPESLVRRVIRIESRGNPRLVSHGNYGLMQIRLGTARAMGYSGTAEGLLDPDTNMTYAVKYLAGAYRAAGGDHDRAISNYQRGYYTRTAKTVRSPAASPAPPGSQTIQTVSAQPASKPNAAPSAQPALQPAPATTMSLASLSAAQTLAPSASQFTAKPSPSLSAQPTTQPVQTSQSAGPPARAAKPSRTGKSAGAPLNLLAFLKRLISPAKAAHKRSAQTAR